MAMKMSDGTNVNINKMIGSSAFNIDFPMQWKNTVIVKLGAEYNVTERFTMRVGYAYGSNPVPTNTLFPVFPAVVENHVTLGGSCKLSQRLTLSGAVESALNNKSTATNPSGIQSEFSGSTSQLETILAHVALNWTL